MIKKVFLFALLGALVLPVYAAQAEDGLAGAMLRISPGTPKDEVLKTLGRPDTVRNQSLNEQKKIVEVWEYDPLKARGTNAISGAMQSMSYVFPWNRGPRPEEMAQRRLENPSYVVTLVDGVVQGIRREVARSKASEEAARPPMQIYENWDSSASAQPKVNKPMNFARTAAYKKPAPVLEPAAVRTVRTHESLPIITPVRNEAPVETIPLSKTEPAPIRTEPLFKSDPAPAPWESQSAAGELAVPTKPEPLFEPKPASEILPFETPAAKPEAAPEVAKPYFSMPAGGVTTEDAQAAEREVQKAFDRITVGETELYRLETELKAYIKTGKMADSLEEIYFSDLMGGISSMSTAISGLRTLISLHFQEGRTRLPSDTQVVVQQLQKVRGRQQELATLNEVCRANKRYTQLVSYAQRADEINEPLGEALKTLQTFLPNLK